MQIRLGYTIELDIYRPTAIVAVLNVHPSRVKDLLEPDVVQVLPRVPTEVFIDTFGNRCVRFMAPQGAVRLFNSTLIEDSGLPDPVSALACEVPVERLPHEVLRFLLASRYCEVDRLLDVAGNLFGNSQPGWARVQAVCD